MNAAGTHLQVKKFIRATRERVFEAWTNPALMKLWYAPGPMSVAAVTSEPKTGGRYSVEMVGEGACDGPTSKVEGVYQKFVPHELLVFSWAPAWSPATESLVTVEFRDAAGGTEVTLTHERLADAESRDKHAHGWTGCLDKLAERFGAAATSASTTREARA